MFEKGRDSGLEQWLAAPDAFSNYNAARILRREGARLWFLTAVFSLLGVK